MLDYLSDIGAIIAGLLPPYFSPSRILILGLGGGSMVHYFQRYYKDANVDVVEIDSQVLPRLVYTLLNAAQTTHNTHFAT